MIIRIFIPLFLSLIILFPVSGQNQDRENIQIKILSFNILHGQTMNNDYDLDVIAAVISKADPDLVALQEVDFKTNRAKKYDLATELGYRTKMAAIFGRAMYYDDGEYGEAVLSKYSFINTRNIILPHSPNHEPRAALEVTVILSSGDTLAFIGTHLDHTRDDKDRLAQARKINQVFSKNRLPTILAGDLNDIPGSRTINEFESVWQSSYDTNPEPTFPSDEPVKKIDYVMTYPRERFKVLKAEVIQDKVASDHCAYLVTLELLPSKN